MSGGFLDPKATGYATMGRLSFKIRFFGMFLPLWVFSAVLTIILFSSLFLDTDSFLRQNFNSVGIFFTMFLFSLIIPVLVEYGIIRARKKNGFSVWGNIEEEIKQREVDEQVRREKKAMEKTYGSTSTTTNKTDIGYWHDLLQKGAITQDEYDAKKNELI
ncbi:SHOCT domain-containing protein [Sulfurimonas sp.]